MNQTGQQTWLTYRPRSRELSMSTLLSRFENAALSVNIHNTKMWANAQRDGRPAEHRWRPLFNATTRCCAVTLPRRETCWNLQGCLKLPNRSQPLVGQSSPYCGHMWRTYCCLTSFFPIVDMCLSCEDIAWQSCAMVPRWRFLATFLHVNFVEPLWKCSFVCQHT